MSTRHFDELTKPQQAQAVDRETTRIAYDFCSGTHWYPRDLSHPFQIAVDAIAAKVGPGPKATEILLSRHYDLVEKEARLWASGNFYNTEKL